MSKLRVGFIEIPKRIVGCITGCLNLAYVMSPVANGTIDFVDYSEALEYPGVVGYVDHTDVPGELLIGHGDTPVFADKKVLS